MTAWPTGWAYGCSASSARRRRARGAAQPAGPHAAQAAGAGAGRHGRRRTAWSRRSGRPAGPAQPDRDLHVLVSRARAVVGADRVVRRDGGYALLADWWDVAELASLAREAARRSDAGDAVGARTAAEGALALVRGPLLADEPDAEWAAEARSAADAAVAEVRRVAAAAALATGQVGDAAAYATEALRSDPYDEAALRTLMRAHAAAGRPASALAEFARVRELLAEELGVDPAPETRALHEELLREEPATGPDAASQATGLVGRVAELRALDAELERSRGGARVVVVSGEPGVGKTALLDHWATTADGARHRGAARPGRGGRARPPAGPRRAGRPARRRGTRGVGGTRRGLPGPGATADALEPAGLRAPRRRRAVAARRRRHRAAARRRRRRRPGDLGLARARAPPARARRCWWSSRCATRAAAGVDAGRRARRGAPGRRRGGRSWSARTARRDLLAAQRRQPAAAHRAGPRRYRPGRGGARHRSARRSAARLRRTGAAERDPPGRGRARRHDRPRPAGRGARHRARWTCSSSSTSESGRRSSPSARARWRSGTSWSGSRSRPGPARPGGPGCTGAPPRCCGPDRTRLRSSWPGTPGRAATGPWRRRGWRTPPSSRWPGSTWPAPSGCSTRRSSSRTAAPLRLRRSRVRMSRGDLDGADTDAEVAMATDDDRRGARAARVGGPQPARPRRRDPARPGRRRDRHRPDDPGQQPDRRRVRPPRQRRPPPGRGGARGGGGRARRSSGCRRGPACSGCTRAARPRRWPRSSRCSAPRRAAAAQGFWVEHTAADDRARLRTARPERGRAAGPGPPRARDRAARHRGAVRRRASTPTAAGSCATSATRRPRSSRSTGLGMAGSQEILAQCHLDVADCLLRAGDLAGAADRLAVAETESGTRWFHNKWRFDQRRRPAPGPARAGRARRRGGARRGRAGGRGRRGAR